MKGLPHKGFSNKNFLAMCESEADATTCFACFRACKSFVVERSLCLWREWFRSLLYNDAPDLIRARVCEALLRGRESQCSTVNRSKPPLI